MPTKIFNCIVATSKYTDSSGNEKSHWENVGAIYQEHDNVSGNPYHYMMLKRTFNPAGIDARENSDSIKITLSRPK